MLVDVVAKSEGLIIMWKQKVSLEFVNYSHRYINVFVNNEDDDTKWLLTYFYGHSEIAKRREVW